MRMIIFWQDNFDFQEEEWELPYILSIHKDLKSFLNWIDNIPGIYDL